MAETCSIHAFIISQQAWVLFVYHQGLVCVTCIFNACAIVVVGPRQISAYLCCILAFRTLASQNIANVIS